MPETVAEKILSNHCRQRAKADEIVTCDIDFMMASDTTAGMVIKAFRAMRGQELLYRDRLVLVLDHAAPAPNRDISNTHKFIRSFAKEHGVRLFEVGRGVCHQLVIENGLVKPGQLALGADSHSTIYGAISAFGAGVGSTDLAVSMRTGKNWLRVPRTMKVVMRGRFSPGVYAKDFMIALISRIGANGACYLCLEFDTEYPLPLSQRMTICNMVAECGAKAGLFYDEAHGIVPDAGCQYERVLEFDLSEIEPMVSMPNSVDRAERVRSVGEVEVQQGFLGSCTNGSLDDFRVAARILAGKQIHRDCRLILAPTSVTMLKQAFEEGVMQTLLDAGATLAPCGCGACVGTHNGIPADGETVISSSNRNFLGRMGNTQARIFLGSPATVAASVLMGRITDPREVMEK